MRISYPVLTEALRDYTMSSGVRGQFFGSLAQKVTEYAVNAKDNILKPEYWTARFNDFLTSTEFTTTMFIDRVTIQCLLSTKEKNCIELIFRCSCLDKAPGIKFIYKVYK